MILNLILTLGISIIFTETPAIDCNSNLDNGCYHAETNVIYLSYKAEDINYTFYHELGHAIFLEDEFSRIIIKDYKPIRNYCDETTHNYSALFNCTSGYKTEKERLDERVANYFAEYMLNEKNFSVYNPSLYIYFRDKLNNL